MTSLLLPKPVPEPKVPKRLSRRGRPARQRKTSLAGLKRKLWCLFAKYIRERDATCVTCGRPANQAGHFYSRRIASVWIDPKNVGAQCPTCNLYLQGNPGAFADYIYRTYGPEELMRLTRRATSVTKQWKAAELQRLIAALERSGADFELAYYEENL